MITVITSIKVVGRPEIWPSSQTDTDHVKTAEKKDDHSGSRRPKSKSSSTRIHPGTQGQLNGYWQGFVYEDSPKS